ncbi:MAG: glycosyltransferase [Butyrivibrio sp.]|nr:glycosyltransferase [Butyrivibrio sp.]
MGLKSAIIKTILYAKRNGIKAAYYAARERMELESGPEYKFYPPSEKLLENQRLSYKSWIENGDSVRISIVVPCYNTPEKYLREMIESVLNQTYANFELILADAGTDEKTAEIIAEYSSKDPRIVYHHLESNNGISENTNVALEMVTGDYTGLLDHDDVLTPDALFEVAHVIRKSMINTRTVKFSNCPVRLIYSDEDKCDAQQMHYYEPNQKLAFNRDYLLSNNYICHFTVVRSDIIKKLKFRKEFDGAQDFDLILRATDGEGDIIHIPKVLYHWRCHEASTAANPLSKRYAYDAGKRAVEDFLRNKNIPAHAVELPHVGFYRTEYDADVFDARPDIGIIGGKLIDKNGTIAGGIYSEEGEILYNGLKKEYSGGFLHRAVLQQDADAVDLRCMKVRPELQKLYKQMLGVDYLDTTRKNINYRELDSDTQITDKGTKIVRSTDRNKDKEAKCAVISDSIAFCKAVREEGYLILWDPQIEKKLK